MSLRRICCTTQGTWVPTYLLRQGPPRPTQGHLKNFCLQVLKTFQLAHYFERLRVISSSCGCQQDSALGLSTRNSSAARQAPHGGKAGRQEMNGNVQLRITWQPSHQLGTRLNCACLCSPAFVTLTAAPGIKTFLFSLDNPRRCSLAISTPEKAKGQNIDTHARKTTKSPFSPPSHHLFLPHLLFCTSVVPYGWWVLPPSHKHTHVNAHTQMHTHSIDTEVVTYVTEMALKINEPKSHC